MSFFDKVKNALLENPDGDNTPKKTKQETVEVNEGTTFPTSTPQVPKQVVDNAYSQTSQELQQYVKSQPQPSVIQPVQIPIQQPTHIAPSPISHVDNCENEVKQVLEQYEAHLAKVNLEGYDFYEFYNAVMSNGIDNVVAYPIIFNTARSFDPTLTSQKITETGQFYLGEIIKAFEDFDKMCKSRLDEFEKTKEAEKNSMNYRIKNIETQIQELQKELSEAYIQLNEVDGKYVVDIERVKCLEFANRSVKSNMETTINKIISNINF